MNVPSLYLEGQLLVAMPSMPDPRFERSVIYVCAHSEEGAMGIVVNKPLESLSFSELLEQLEIETSHVDERIRV
ncbi:MAG TPA: YqgE/AlgH family protein, partial [Alphaproteobacteria bacterium]|nr:YqgE/AlgH family protein [Alphaproteobacteria bacterium]